MPDSGKVQGVRNYSTIIHKNVRILLGRGDKIIIIPSFSFMFRDENNFAFIDSQNLNLAIRSLGWQLDFGRFRTYLSEKYHVTRAYLFLGYIPENHRLYTRLQNMGYICIFKPTLQYPGEKIKGNCDAELVLQSMIDFQHYCRAIVITGDGDFHCLIKYLIAQNKLEKLLIPNQHHYSSLLKRFPS